MGEAHALRHPGRAAGVEDIEIVARLDRRRGRGEGVGADRVAGREPGVERPGAGQDRGEELDHPLERRRCREGAGARRGELGQDAQPHLVVAPPDDAVDGEEQPRPRMPELLDDLGVEIEGVERREDRADAGAAEREEQPLGPVGAVDRDDVAAADARGEQRPGPAVGDGVELRPGEGLALEAERRARAVACGVGTQKPAEGQGGRLRLGSVTTHSPAGCGRG